MITSAAIDRPVFVIGTGRCGLSPLMDLIAYHKDFAWPSQYHDSNPQAYRLALLSRIVELPFFNSRLKFRWMHGWMPMHSEAFAFWNSMFGGFGAPFRDLRAEDVTPLVKLKFRKAVQAIAHHQGKRRFLAEYSGWSRIPFMQAVFPNAQFIHIVRDGRAVANSLINVDYWMGWGGVHKWRWGMPNEDSRAQLEKHNYSFLALAAVQWKILVNNILEQSAHLPQDKILVVRYEDLVESPRELARRCIEFCGLDKDCPKFEKHLSTVRIVNANSTTFRIPAWRESITTDQRKMLDEILQDELKFFNYA